MPALRPRPRFATRDKDGLLILTNLESTKRLLDPNYDPDKEYRDEDEDEEEEANTLLFNRNWAITEPRTGPSFREFINYDKL